MNARRAVVSALLALLLAANALFLHVHVRFATCPMPNAGDRDASHLLTVVVGFGRVGDPACTEGTP